MFNKFWSILIFLQLIMHIFCLSKISIWHQNLIDILLQVHNRQSLQLLCSRNARAPLKPIMWLKPIKSTLMEFSTKSTNTNGQANSVQGKWLRSGRVMKSKCLSFTGFKRTDFHVLGRGGCIECIGWWIGWANRYMEWFRVFTDSMHGRLDK